MKDKMFGTWVSYFKPENILAWSVFFANLIFHTEDCFDKLLEQKKQKTCMRDKIRFLSTIDAIV